MEQMKEERPKRVLPQPGKAKKQQLTSESADYGVLLRQEKESHQRTKKALEEAISTIAKKEQDHERQMMSKMREHKNEVEAIQSEKENLSTTLVLHKQELQSLQASHDSLKKQHESLKKNYDIERTNLVSCRQLLCKVNSENGRLRELLSEITDNNTHSHDVAKGALDEDSLLNVPFTGDSQLLSTAAELESVEDTDGTLPNTPFSSLHPSIISHPNDKSPSAVGFRLFQVLQDYDPPESRTKAASDADKRELKLFSKEYIKIYGILDTEGYYTGETFDGFSGLVPFSFVEEVIELNRINEILLGLHASFEKRPSPYNRITPSRFKKSKTVTSTRKNDHHLDSIEEIDDEENHDPNTPFQPKYLLALFSYDARAMSPNDPTDELSFPKGAIIVIVEPIDENGFYVGCLKGSIGLIPSNYVKELHFIPRGVANNDVSGPDFTNHASSVVHAMQNLPKSASTHNNIINMITPTSNKKNATFFQSIRKNLFNTPNQQCFVI